MLIVTLIAANSDVPSLGLSQHHIDSAQQLLAGAGLRGSMSQWLEHGQAARIELQDARSVSFDAIRATLAPLSDILDIAVRTADAPLPKLVLSDMDSTMIAQECIDELADYAGMREAVTAITERAMQGELDFAASLKERVALLKGLPEHVIAECLAERIRPNPGARIVVQTLRQQGAQTVLVSGGFHHFADPIAAELGFHGVTANRLDVVKGHLTGTISGALVDAQMKAHVLARECGLLCITAQHSMALGDGANDIPMLQAAGLSIAYRAKPTASAAADIAIRHSDLTASLYALGLPRSKWAEI